MAKATKSRTLGKAGSKPGAGAKPRKAATVVPGASKAKGKAMNAAKPVTAAPVKALPKPAVSVAGAKLVGPAATKKVVRPAEGSVTIEISKESAPAAAAKVDVAAPRASSVVEPQAVVEREGTPPALPVPIASFTF